MSSLDQLISKLSWSRMGLDGEDLSQYIPRGVSVQDTVHAASELERLSAANAELLEALDAVDASSSDKIRHRNGRITHAEGDNGEKLWLVPDEVMGFVRDVMAKHRGGAE